MERWVSMIYRREWILILFLIGFCFILYFMNLDRWDLWGVDEPRYAEVAREMVTGGDWVLMHYNGRIYSDKPPLFFWAIALSSYLWQGFTSYSARFPSAFFGTLTILLTFIFGRTLYSVKAGFFSGVILATSFEFASLSVRASLDTTLTFFITASILCFILWFRWKKKMDRRSHFTNLSIYGFYIGMAFATSTKGPVGFILPLLVVLIYLFFRRDWRIIREMKLLSGMVLFAILVLCWYFPALIKGGREHLNATLLLHTIDRFARGIAHVQPIYYYFLKFPINFFPWIIFLPIAIAYGISTKNIMKRMEFIFLFVWFIVMFLFFSLSKGKRGIYLLPLYPANSLMIGELLNQFVSGSMDQNYYRWISYPFYALMGLTLLSGIALPFGIYMKFPYYLSYSLTIVLLLVGGSIILFLAIRFRHFALSFLIIVGIFTGGFFYTLRVVFPMMNPFKSARFISQKITSEIHQEEKLAVYRFESGPYNFYTGIVPISELVSEKALIHFLSSSERVFCLIRIMDLESIKMKNNLSITELAFQNDGGEKGIVLVSNRPSSFEAYRKGYEW